MNARLPFWTAVLVGLLGPVARADPLEPVGGVEAQPLAANCERVRQSLQMLGAPIPELAESPLGDARALQRAMDGRTLLVVQINPESRVTVQRGPARAVLVQHGYTPMLVKVVNEAQLSARLRIRSPQAGAVYAGAAELSLQRQQQTELNDPGADGRPGRLFDVQLWTAPPLTPELSGLKVEYVVALISCSEAGQREATLAFDVGQGTQDLGFRGEAPVLFEVQPAVPVKLSIRDHDGLPAMARLTFRDKQGRIHPAQAKRLAPDFFFQPHIYRRDGESLLLAPGDYELTSCRGPEYVERVQTLTIKVGGAATLEVRLERWIEPAQYGFYSGDHHIHGAGCAHYQSPTEGVAPEDMFRQVSGEGLNVGCVLTWGPCFDFQRNYFSPGADAISEPLTVLKYDLEISGFGSAALGHVCLLNLRDQTYPGSQGTKTLGWPTWTVPVLKWAKDQGGTTGYPHSDMRVEPPAAALRLLTRNDRNQDRVLDADEAGGALLPAPFAASDQDQDGRLSLAELSTAAERACNQLPNLVVPTMSGAGAMEIFVSAPAGVCDFISAMDTGRIGEWNAWYHILNCGYPLKVAGETDFPCMSSLRVGQGRSYVKLGPGPVPRVDFGAWCDGLAAGRSYVSDGFAHALEFRVNGAAPGDADVQLAGPGRVRVHAAVAFAARRPQGVAYGDPPATGSPRDIGDTVLLHGPRKTDWIAGDEQLVEVVRNGQAVASARVLADGRIHMLDLEIEVDRSSWISLRQFPQMHTNPVNVLIGGRPIRASIESARWCGAAVEVLWERRHKQIAEAERPAAREAYDRAAEEYRRRGAEAGAP